MKVTLRISRISVDRFCLWFLTWHDLYMKGLLTLFLAVFHNSADLRWSFPDLLAFSTHAYQRSDVNIWSLLLPCCTKGHVYSLQFMPLALRTKLRFLLWFFIFTDVLKTRIYFCRWTDLVLCFTLLVGGSSSNFSSSISTPDHLDVLAGSRRFFQLASDPEGVSSQFGSFKTVQQIRHSDPESGRKI